MIHFALLRIDEYWLLTNCRWFWRPVNLETFKPTIVLISCSNLLRTTAFDTQAYMSMEYVRLVFNK